MEDSKVFLQGMGGIGKSELAKNYAAEHREQYETVVFATYQTCLRDLILYDKVFQMEGLPRAYNRDGVMEDDAAYFARKLERLQETTTAFGARVRDKRDRLLAKMNGEGD